MGGLIECAQLFTPWQVRSPGRVWVEGDAIAETGHRHRSVPSGCLRVDAGSCICVPGFIDAQSNGAFGHDVMGAFAGDIRAVAERLVAHGVTAFLPTAITAEAEEITAALVAVREAKNRPPPRAARILGAHTEGPFLNPERAGAHPVEYLRPFSPSLWAQWWDASGGTIRMVTLAPEIPGNLAAVAKLRGQGIAVAMGHSNATFEESQAAFQQGVGAVTHLFNAASPFHQRAPGVVGAALLADGVTASVIADLEHVHPANLALLFRMKGSHGVAVVTDQTAPAGCPPGEYMFAGKRVKTDTTSSRFADSGGLAGSITFMDQSFRNLVAQGLALRTAARACTTNPARMLGLRLGSIVSGYPADLVLLDDTLSVQATMVGGQWVHGLEFVRQRTDGPAHLDAAR